MARKMFTFKNLFILVLQGCFLLSGIFFMGSNHGFVSAVYADGGTPGLSFALVNGVYHVDKGTVAADITQIEIPATYEGVPVRQIASSGFANLLDLQTVVLPEGLTHLNTSAFSGCTSLQNIVLPNTLISLGINAFRNCTSLTSMVLPSSVTTVNSSAFYGCTSLQSIVLPNTITIFGNSVFTNCASLTNIMTNGTEKQTNGTFGIYVIDASGTAVTTGGMAVIVTSGGGASIHTLASAVGTETSVTVPSSVTHLGTSAFSGYASLVSVSLPNTLATLARNAFFQCTNLVSIVIPNSVTTMGDAVFYGCTSLTSITLPSSITSFGAALRQCPNLTNINIDSTAKQTDGTNGIYVLDASGNAVTTGGVAVVLVSGTNHTLVVVSGSETSITVPAGITHLGNTAFREYVSLTSINLPNSLQHIGNGTFSYTSLTSLTLPNSLTFIDHNAFSYVSFLTNITIPSSVTGIGGSAFWECTNLIRVVMQSEIPPILATTSSFTNTHPNLKIQVPVGSVDSYKAATNWITYENYITEDTYFVVAFKDADQSMLSLQTTLSGGSAIAPSNPLGFEDAQYTITFSGWDVPFASVTSDLTVTATYSQTVNEYTVIFKDWDDSTLDTQAVAYGSGAVAPTNPTRAATAQYTYAFDGWDTAFDNITGDLTITATYTQTLNEYTVTFKNWDDSILDTQTVAYGSGAVAPTSPSKAATAQYTFAFDGWDTAFDNITGDLTVTAVYASNLRSYVVTFHANGGTAVAQQNVVNGTLVSRPTDPTNQALTFSGWYIDQALQTAWNFETDYMPTNDITLYASWTVSITVVVGTEEMALQVGQGIELDSITPPIQLGHTFSHWTYNNQLVNAQTIFNYAQDILLVAVFMPNSYVIYFDVNGAEGEMNSILVVYGQAIGMLPAPVREGYVLKGWAIDGQTITSETLFTFANNVTLVAQWQEVPEGINPILLGGAAAAAGLIFIASAYAISSKKKLKVIASQITNQGEILKQIKQQTAPKSVNPNPTTQSQVHANPSKPPLPPKPPAK